VARPGRFAPAAVAATVAVALALAGCGGSSGVSPAAYVKTRCTVVSGWKTAVQNAGTKLSADQPKTLAQGKQDYVRFVAALLGATRHAHAAIGSAGTPAVSNGAHLASALVDAFSGAERQFSQAASKAARIPTTTTTAYAKAVTGVTASIRQTLTSMGGVNPGASAQLESAAAKEPACKSLVSAG
jgi:hypothetical protein